MLNLDYKIASKSIANRIIDLLPNIIHHNQTGFVKDRNISDSIRTLLDTITYTDRLKCQGLMLFLDLEKAFDTLENDFMLKALKCFNFGKSLIQWVKTFYKDISSCIMNNGMSTGYFNVSRGVRQGDPLSPYLFTLSLEILSHNIRENNKIKGIKIDDEELKLVQHADDTTSTLSDKESALELLKVIDKFSKISGLKLNHTKTELFWLGNQKFSKDKINFITPKEYVNVLGITLGHNYEEVLKRNLEKKLGEIANTFNMWKQRNLSISGRICLAKVYGISKINYISAAFQISEPYIKRLESILYSFIWKGKNDKVKRNTLIADYSQGGQRMLDIRTILMKYNIKFIQRYLGNTNSNWKRIFEYFLKSFGGPQFLLQCNYDIKELHRKLPTFYLEVFKTWKTFLNNFYNLENNKYIWNNETIKINGRTVFNKDCLESGMWYISDLFDQANSVIPFQTWEERGLDRKYFLLWRALVQILRKRATDNILTQNYFSIVLNPRGKRKPITKIKPKTLYVYLLQSKVVTGPANKEKFEAKFGNIDWQTSWLIPINACEDHKLRELQYKILNRYLNTNYQLKKYGLKDTNACDLCNENPETICHLFWDCNMAKTLWLQFYEWWANTTNLKNYQINQKIVILGFHETLPESNLYNHLILIVKNYILLNKSKTLSLVAILELIKSTHKIEKCIANKNGTLLQYLQKWQPILNYL